MDKTELIESVLKPFLVQANLKAMKTAMFPKEYDEDIRIKVGLGQGVASNVPFVAFLGDGQDSQQGIYPVVAYFKEAKRLFLAYGESVAGESMVKWDEVGKEKIEEYANKRNIRLNSSEIKYSQEKIYSVYEVHDGIISESDMEALAIDISKIMVEYKELMMEKSKVENMNIDVLGDVFKHTATSYKYYWALSLLDLVKEGRTMCSFHEATIGMLVRAWRDALDGKFLKGNDKMYEVVRGVKDLLMLDEDMSEDILKMKMRDGLVNNDMRKLISGLELNVPYRFLSPWIVYKSDEDIRSRSSQFENGCPYEVLYESVKLNPHWKEYLQEECDNLIGSVENKLDEYLNN